jgi:hypothetical protein
VTELRLELLDNPWGLYLLSSKRRVLLDNTEHELDSGASPVLFGGKAPEIDGRESVLEIEAEFNTRLGERQWLASLPVPLRANEAQSLRLPSWTKGGARLRWRGAPSRPAIGRDREDEGNDGDLEGAKYLDFTLRLVGRMHDIESAIRRNLSPWEETLGKWINREQSRPPQMDLIVRHAAEYRRHFAEVVLSPRKILSRRRQLMPLDRVEELDTHCMEWLCRQPGNTIPERAGDRQRILALARYENQNTLENRVLHDVLDRSAGIGREYLRLNSGKHHTQRYKAVEGYGLECRRLSQEMSLRGVSRLFEMPQPNFVLLQDSRYRRVWTAFRELIDRERQQDEVWRWQRRSWAEFCRVGTILGALLPAGADVIAGSPIAFRSEQYRGQWLIHDDPIVVILNRRKKIVVEVLRGRGADLPLGAAEMGAAAWLRIGDTAGSELRYAAVWAIHGVGSARSLESLVEGAGDALSLAHLKGKIRIIGGIVMQSDHLPDGEAVTLERNSVRGIRFGPGEAQLQRGLEMIQTAIENLAQRPS